MFDHPTPAAAPHPSLAIALAIAAGGLPTFPCLPSKAPAISGSLGGNGFRDATTDPDRIRELWALAGAGAKLCGVPTGAASGLDVLDVDPRHGGHLWEAEHRDGLGETRVHGTMSGGQHRLFRHHPGVRNGASDIAPGVDVRGEGGYVIWPPSPGYTIVHSALVAPWPSWLLPLVLKAAEAVSNGTNELHGTPPAKITDARVNGIVAALLGNVSRARDGAKHYTLRNNGIALGGYLHLVGWTEAQAVEQLVVALPATVKDWKLAHRTAAWAVAEGRLRPQTLPDRERWGRSAA